MEKERKKSKKKCFIITPIGPNSSEIRREIEGVIDAAILPLLERKSFEGVVAHRINKSGSINTQVIEHIVNDDLAIVNLTGLNPNVMYELAVRHATGKPVIIIAKEGTSNPFDIVDQRTIYYENDMKGALDLTNKLEGFIDEVLGHEVDNPLINIIKEKSILDSVSNDKDRTIDSLLLEKLSAIEKQLSKNSNDNSIYNNSQFSPITFIFESEEDCIKALEIASNFSMKKRIKILNYSKNTIVLVGRTLDLERMWAEYGVTFEKRKI